MTLKNSPQVCHASTASILNKWKMPALAALTILSPKSLRKWPASMEHRPKKVSTTVNAVFQ